MGSLLPPQYELFKSRITSTTSKYWAVVHIFSMDPNQDPTEVCFNGKSMPTLKMAIEVAAYEAVTRLRFAVPYANERGYCYCASRAAPRGATSFPGTLAERDPMLIWLVQYVIAQERSTQRLMDFLQALVVQNPQTAIGESLRLDPAGHILRVLQPFAPQDEGDIPLREIFSHDR
ncbi:hypothetical protein D1007_47550 [Hordeum vulgare]|nr:hypothetical protein D1007_47550 [Hordeum vulgare]